MAAICYQKEQDDVESEARRRLNLQKIHEKMQKEKEEEYAARNAVFISMIQQAAEEKERNRKNTITGINARIKRIEYDVDCLIESYKTVMNYRNAMPEEQRHTMNSLLEHIKKTHNENKSLLARTMIDRDIFMTTQ